MKKIIVLASMVLAQAAHADLTRCQTADGAVRVKASSAVLVISDSSIQPGNKTTARFTAENGTLKVEPSSDDATVYTGDVDLRFNDTSLGGRNLLGTKLGYVDTIEVQVFGGDRQGQGEITLNKRNGQTITAELSCE
jgi:hypothetical protein